MPCEAYHKLFNWVHAHFAYADWLGWATETGMDCDFPFEEVTARNYLCSSEVTHYTRSALAEQVYINSSPAVLERGQQPPQTRNN